MDIQNIAERIKICILTQSFWMPKRRHKTETQEENRRHNLDDDAEVYIKLIKHQGLYNAGTIKNKIYKEHKRLTLPSPHDGMRIVPIGREFEHSETLQKLNSQFKSEIGSFFDDYPQVIEDSKKRLKELYDSSMFPPLEVMKTKFNNQTRYMCAPTEGDWGNWIEEVSKIGQSELQDRLVNAARHLIKVCSGDGNLYSSVLDNLRDICELAGDFNLRDDPIIERAANELLPVAKDYSVNLLRDNRGLRKETARRAQEILSVLKLS